MGHALLPTTIVEFDRRVMALIQVPFGGTPRSYTERLEAVEKALAVLASPPLPKPDIDSRFILAFHLNGKVELGGDPWKGTIVNYAMAEHVEILAKLKAEGNT